MAKKSMSVVKEEIRELVAEISEVPVEKLVDGAKFYEDLGVDSMKALEIVATIEKKYKIRIPEEKIPTLRALENVFEVIEKNFK